MRLRQPKLLRSQKRGFTLVELAIAIAIIAILAAFSFVSYFGTEEVRDATMVQSAQASLQTIVSQGAARMDVTPRDLRDTYSDAIVSAMQDTLGQKGSQNAGVEFEKQGTSFILTIRKGTPHARTARFSITDTGDVSLDALSNFSLYMQGGQNGIIKKI